jgi:hypothetical protein
MVVVVYKEYVGREKAAGWFLFEEAQGAGEDRRRESSRSKERSRKKERGKKTPSQKLSIAFRKRLATKKWIKDIQRFSSQATSAGPV